MFKALIVSLLLAIPSVSYADKEHDILYPTVEIRSSMGQGSGTAVKGDIMLGTYIMTNYHVAFMSNEISVRFYGEDKDYPAYVHSYNKDLDIAVIITRHRTEHYATMGEEDDIKLFKEVICSGNSLGQGIVPSKGIITDEHFPVPLNKADTIRMECKITPGNSGGGMYTEKQGKWVYLGMPSAGLVERGITVAHLGVSVRVSDVVDHLRYHRIFTDVSPYEYGAPF